MRIFALLTILSTLSIPQAFANIHDLCLPGIKNDTDAEKICSQHCWWYGGWTGQWRQNLHGKSNGDHACNSICGCNDIVKEYYRPQP